MPVRNPSIDDLRRAAEAYHLTLTHEDLVSFRDLAGRTIASYRRLDQLVEPKLPVKYPRDTGYRPGPEQNPLNAWYWKCSIKGAPSGKLAGKTIAIKDNVCVAGIPMMNGTSVLEGFIPDIDATIITRILDAGGEIAGKAVCESLCFSGGSHTSDPAGVQNPHRPGYSAGGSSSGSAALVAAGEVDMAIGGDQGGSIRIPAAWCGIVGLKPTYGLVPYTGIFPLELTLDHVGPMARTVPDLALLLEVIAGNDELDPRQRNVRTESYARTLDGSISGLRLALVREAFGWECASEKDVDQIVRDAAHELERQGAKVTTISLPYHRDGVHIHKAIITEGSTMLVMKGNSAGTNWKGYYMTNLLDAFARGWRSRADDLPETVKLAVLVGHYMQERYHGRYYAKAQNLGRALRETYDAALREADLLVMPTTPMKARPLPAPNASREETVAAATEMDLNTCPFDVTGHPALTVPCGMSEGLPVGIMLIGRHWDDGTVLRAAYAFERVTKG